MPATLELPAEFHSLSGRVWRPRPCDERIATAIARLLGGAPEIIGRVLAARGVMPDDAPLALAPTLRSLLPDPSHLRDMDAAACRLAEAVIGGEKICIWGDYDVDGATSTALLLRLLRLLGHEAGYYIPDRLREGYGPNAPALLKLSDEGTRVVVTVDCGTTAHEALTAAHAAGLTVIVVDHHQGDAALPPAHAVVNPNRLDETSPHGHMAAVGVSFLLAVALVRELRRRGYFTLAMRPEPELLGLLDLVALGTVCDVVPLTGVNRAFVCQGLKAMAARANCGIAAVMRLAGVDEAPSAYHAGFVIGPRINAGGRVGRSDLGARLLATDDPAEAHAIAAELERHNAERKVIEAMALEDAITLVEREQADDPLICVAQEGWHPGVIGIVAGRLKERFDRPAMVIALEGDVGKASARSAGGFDIGALVLAARAEGLLLAGGGHAMAAGFTIARERIGSLRAYANARVAAFADGAGVRPVHYDGMLAPGGVTAAFAEMLEQAGPFGAGYPEPRFVLSCVQVLKVDVLKESHLRLVVAGHEDGSRSTLKGMAFRAVGTPMGEALLSARGGAWHLLGRVKASRWQGRVSGEFWLEDACPA